MSISVLAWLQETTFPCHRLGSSTLPWSVPSPPQPQVHSPASPTHPGPRNSPPGKREQERDGLHLQRWKQGSCLSGCSEHPVQKAQVTCALPCGLSNVLAEMPGFHPKATQSPCPQSYMPLLGSSSVRRWAMCGFIRLDTHLMSQNLQGGPLARDSF